MFCNDVVLAWRVGSRFVRLKAVGAAAVTLAAPTRRDRRYKRPSLRPRSADELEAERVRARALDGIIRERDMAKYKPESPRVGRRCDDAFSWWSALE